MTIPKSLTKQQLQVLEFLKESKFFTENFYFSGGTALSGFYLNHRISDDLDFFSTNVFDSFSVNSLVQKISERFNAPLTARQIEDTFIFNLSFSDNYILKLDFAHYPYTNTAPFNIWENLKIDSMKDIAVNKFTVISYRKDIKDFVDLYYLLKEFSIFDLFELSKRKFKRDYDLLLFASDLLKITQFDYMPKMLKPLEIGELQEFYVDLARDLGLRGSEI